MENGGEVPKSLDRAEIASQKELLAEIQAANSKQFDESGMAEKVRNFPGMEDDTLSSDRMLASVFRKNSDAGHNTQVYSIAVLPNENAKTIPTRYLPVVEVTEDGLALHRGEFDNDDAATIQGMIKGLQEAKQVGLLPNLRTDCMGITDPQMGISMHKKETY